jgi:hypothetical protein
MLRVIPNLIGVCPWLYSIIGLLEGCTLFIKTTKIEKDY